MSLRPTTILWMVFLAVGFFGLYMIKYKVQAVKIEVAAAEQLLLEEKRNLHVLEAEWSYLNRPERLAQLSAKYLHLASLTGQQLASFSSLPIGNPAMVMRQTVEKVAQKPAPQGITLASGASHGR